MKNRNKKGKPKISFDEELVTKEDAKQIITELNQQKDNSTLQKTQIKRKHNFEAENTNNKTADNNKKVKKKHKVISESPKDDRQSATIEVQPTIGEKKESNRASKRNKHAKLLEQKKLKTELDLQQKALNYLSKWKHNRIEWKFEKLRQVWLQQNFLDVDRVPDEFWDTAVQYFSGSRGHSRQVVLETCIKLIESDATVTDEERTDDYQVKLKRARDIVQNLE